jgi:hypothetical protein
MSQTIVPPRAGPAGAGAGAPGPDPSDPVQPAAEGTLRARLAAGSVALRHWLDGTPGRLRVAATLSVIAALLVGFGGGAALRERASALDEVKDSAAHLVLVQGVETRLVQADADVTNGFLHFGLEPSAQQVDYIDSVGAASRDLARAARASSQDAEVLGDANVALTRYTGYISSARANNRAGEPVGANYLSTAHDLLAEQIITPLRERATADQAKIDAAYSRASHASSWLGVLALIGLAGLIGSQVYLARSSRRILNPPLAASTAGLVVVLLIAGGAMLLAQSRANDVRDGALNDATHLSLSRVAAFNAKSSEALTLIQRGSATSADTDWRKLYDEAVAQLPRDDGGAAAALAAYAEQHQAINALDLKGEWLDAKDLAIKGGKASANGQFAAFNGATEGALTQQAASTASKLDKAGNLLLPAGLLLVLAGLLAAVGAWWGVSLRLDEYR